MIYRGQENRKTDHSRLALILTVLALAVLFIAGCSEHARGEAGYSNKALTGKTEQEEGQDRNESESGSAGMTLVDDVPDYSGAPYIMINGNEPKFSRNEIKRAKKEALRKGRRFEIFTELDGLGRCGMASAVVSAGTMPEGERGSIGMIKPSGWQLDKYDLIDNGGYLYNRCHLIGWQLTGQNDEVRNLITGTRYMNVEGMLPFENEVAEYVRTYKAHVLYRAVPVFRAKELVARGVQIEAYSLEDDGEGLSINVYCYNVQPGVVIDYSSGKSKADPGWTGSAVNDGSEEEKTGPDESKGTGEEKESGPVEKTEPALEPEIPEGVTYILNNNTMRFHRTDCRGARTIAEHNREWFYGDRDEALERGYVPCGMCKP